MFWETFKKLCDMNNTTPNGVCAKLGMSTAAATHWKNGSIPKMDTLVKLADYFDISVGALFDGIEALNDSGTSGGQVLEDLSNSQLELLNKFDQLSTEQQEDVLQYVNFIISKREKNGD